VLKDGQPMATAVTIEQNGTFNLATEGPDHWKTFTSRQRGTMRRPGFVWDGRVPILPGVAVHVHDAYVVDESILHPAIAGLVTLADLRGGGEVAQGESMRFVAEAAWYPRTLLPSQGVRWGALDERSARANLTDSAVSATPTFRFGADRLIDSVRPEARGRTDAGKIVPTPWEGRCMNYQARHGMRVPMSGEVAWVLSEGRKPYGRATMTALRYEFAQ
jgi:hypothetical protein